MTAAPKLCKDCLNYIPDGSPDCASAHNSETNSPDYVNGITPPSRPIWYSAQRCREDAKTCGPDAKWWEPKQ